MLSLSHPVINLNEVLNMTEIVTDPTSTQAKQEINCCDAKYWDLLNTGELEGYYVGRTLRVTRESIEAFKNSSSIGVENTSGAPKYPLHITLAVLLLMVSCFTSILSSVSLTRRSLNQH